MPQNILDNLTKMKKIDNQNVLGSLQLLGKQVEQIWGQASDLKVPANYKKIENIVVLGMGGSTLGSYVFKSLFFQDLRVPVDIINDYHIPKFVNNKTLVIASSYSGTTEEPLNAVKEARKKKAKIVVISSGNKLASWGKRNKYPSLIFTTENNPCGQPRMSLGYMIFGQIAFLNKTDLLRISQKQIKQVVRAMGYYNTQFGALTPTKENQAKQLALKAVNHSVWHIASEHLCGNAHAASNQMNESAKRFSGFYFIPELNHHLMEGIVYPSSNKSNLLFVLFQSKLYGQRIQKRYKITEKVLNKNSVQYFSYHCQELDKLLQVCEILVFSSYVSYYCAILKGVNPNLIPFVDYFKEQLKKL